MASNQNDQPEEKVPAPPRAKPKKRGFYTNKIHYLRMTILDVLPRKKFAYTFMKPMDAKKKPQYYVEILKPIDIGTIHQRALNSYYQDVDEMILDFNLLITNNKSYYMAKSRRQYINCLKLEQFITMSLMKMPRGEERIIYGKPPVSSTDSMTESDTESDEE